jgi:hypothetical protein
MHFPIFKFLEKKYINSTIIDGEIRIATLHEFRDKEKYKGKIFDDKEGILTIINKYSFEKIKEECGGLLHYKETSININLSNYKILKKKILLENHYIYSVSSNLFTDSFLQAIEDSKNACVMIVFPKTFFQKVTFNMKMAQFIGFKKCLYTGKILTEINPIKNSKSDYFLNNKEEILFLKPNSYHRQMEARAVWKSFEKEINYIFIKNTTLTPYMREIVIDMDSYDNILSKSKFKITVVKKNGKDAIGYIERPAELFSPVIFLWKTDKIMLGFRSETTPKKYKIDIFRNNDIDVYPTKELGLILFCNDFFNIAKIIIKPLE